MSKITEIFKKVSKAMGSGSYEPKEKITANEAELMSYKRKEYLHNVKQELRHYRKKYNYFQPDDSEPLIQKGSSIMAQKPNLVGSNNVFKRGRKI